MPILAELGGRLSHGPRKDPLKFGVDPLKMGKKNSIFNIGFGGGFFFLFE